VFLTFGIADVGGVIVVIQIAVDSDKTVTWGEAVDCCIRASPLTAVVLYMPGSMSRELKRNLFDL
jgi:hypothetical protein